MVHYVRMTLCERNLAGQKCMTANYTFTSSLLNLSEKCQGPECVLSLGSTAFESRSLLLSLPMRRLHAPAGCILLSGSRFGCTLSCLQKVEDVCTRAQASAGEVSSSGSIRGSEAVQPFFSTLLGAVTFWFSWARPCRGYSASLVSISGLLLHLQQTITCFREIKNTVW